MDLNLADFFKYFHKILPFLALTLLIVIQTGER